MRVERNTNHHSFNCWLSPTEYDELRRSTESYRDELVIRFGGEDAAVVAGVFGWYWCQGIGVGEIEERTNVDPTSIRMTARQLSRTPDAASALFDAIRATQPEWYDDLVFSVEKGVPREELPIARAVHGVGRATIQGLREYFGEAADQVEREDQLRDILRGINGIGKARSKSLAAFARLQDGDPISTSLSAKTPPKASVVGRLPTLVIRVFRTSCQCCVEFGGGGRRRDEGTEL